jgi:hypothetical protein
LTNAVAFNPISKNEESREPICARDTSEQFKTRMQAIRNFIKKSGKAIGKTVSPVASLSDLKKKPPLRRPNKISENYLF